MKFMTRETIKHLENTLENSYSLPIFRGYKAINKYGVEKLIDELYANLPDDVKKAREYLKTRNYELNTNKKGSTIYDSIQKLETALDNGMPLLTFSRIIILNIRDIEELLNQIQNNLPEEILKAEILSRQ